MSASVLAPPAAPEPVALQTDLNQEAARRRQLAGLTVLCLLGWAGGLLGEHLFAWPHVLIHALYVGAFLAGGYACAGKVVEDLRQGEVSIDLLMVLGAVGAAVVDAWAEGAFLLFLFALSHLLESAVLDRTRRAITALLDLRPDQATLRHLDGREERVPVESLRPGDVVTVRPGERLPADGVVAEGHTAIDQAALTGESMPVDRSPEEAVFAGTLNQQGAVAVRVTRAPADSALARMVRLVAEAQQQKGRSQRLTEWFGARYTFLVLALGGATLLIPWLGQGEAFSRAFYRAMTVLVVASPCAVVLAVPAALLTAIARAARGGVLFKSGAHLETAARLRAVAIDKTGTLTVGRPRLTDLAVVAGTEPMEVLRLAAAAEQRSEHPLATAVTAAARERGLPVPPATEVQAVVGKGLRAVVEGRHVWVGKQALAGDRPVPTEVAAAADRWAAAGQTLLYVGDEGGVLGVLTVADVPRPTAVAALQQLRTLGVTALVMLTGDHARVAQAMAGTLRLAYRADLLPEDKLAAVRDLSKDHGPAAMVGDGINDAPALAAADLGVTLGGVGTDVALEAADLVLMGTDLRLLPWAVALARQARRIIVQNLVFALTVIALLLLAAFSDRVRLPLAVVGHEGSTVLVILNGLRLLAFPGLPRGALPGERGA